MQNDLFVITEFENELVKNVAMECKIGDMTEDCSSRQWRFEAKSAGKKKKDDIRHAVHTC